MAAPSNISSTYTSTVLPEVQVPVTTASPTATEFTDPEGVAVGVEIVTAPDAALMVWQLSESVAVAVTTVPPDKDNPVTDQSPEALTVAVPPVLSVTVAPSFGVVPSASNEVP